MTEARFHAVLLASWLAVAGLTALALLLVVAPYGRHARAGWGPTVRSRLGWTLMEAPSALGMVALAAVGPGRGAGALVLGGMWVAHYLHRAFVYPWARSGSDRPMPLAVVALGVAFNAVNVYLNGRWLFALGPGRGASWLAAPRFLAGAALFVAGAAINLRSDAILARLRGPGESGYGIPRGFLYEKVSCPNYLGEIVEWSGWALAAWSLPGLSFAAWTTANLAPRALAHHRWYRQRFPDYPPERKALVPGLL
jgi:hypothetical protein